MKIWFTSDLHIGHRNVIRYCNRPYETVEEMNEDLIKRYNEVVGDKDVVYFLGDIGLCGKPILKDVFSRLKGKKILVLGNHDKYSMATYYEVGFNAVLQSCRIKIGKSFFTLNHVPRRNIFEVIRLFREYIFTMRKKKRTFKQIYERLMRELRYLPKSKTMFTICGHVHEKWKVRNKNINVGVDVWDYKPVSSDKILVIKNDIER